MGPATAALLVAATTARAHVHLAAAPRGAPRVPVRMATSTPPGADAGGNCPPASSVPSADSSADPEHDWRSERALRSRKHTKLYADLAGGARSAPGRVTPVQPRRPSVLAPAGGWPQLRAAVAAGADAVYFGCAAGLNARARAANFGLDELPAVMTYLRARGVRGYMCLNVLVFDEELELGMPEALVCAAAAAGVDAIIVQDLAVARLARRVAPNLPLHASTQMSVTDGHGAVHAAHATGAETVVVGRELSISDIAEVRRALDLAGLEHVAVECFVHGALCVSYSGQCFSSETWGGRSANRGQCAQACRMPYGLMVDGHLSGFVDANLAVRGHGHQHAGLAGTGGEADDGGAYLLSPQDLAVPDLVPDLVRAGVGTLKIEGRLKGPEYVYAATRVYRAAVDEACSATAESGGLGLGLGLDLDLDFQEGTEGQGEGRGAAGLVMSSPSPPAARAVVLDPWTPDRADLAQLFARAQDATHDGLSHGFLRGPAHQSLVRARTPGHRGVLVATVAEAPPTAAGTGAYWRTGGAARPPAVSVHLRQPLRRGDGLVFDDPGQYEADEEVGGFVLDVLDEDGKPAPPEAQLRGGRFTIVLQAPPLGRRRKAPLGARTAMRTLRRGQNVWRTRQPSLEKQISTRLLRADSLGRERVKVSVRGCAGEALVVALEDAEGRRGEGRTQQALEASHRVAGDPLALARATQRAIGDLGGSGVATGAYDASALEPGLHVPACEIKAARRDALAALAAVRNDHGRAFGLAASPALPRPNPGASHRSLPALVAPCAGSATAGTTAGQPRLSVLCRTLAQVEALATLPSACGPGAVVDEIVCDMLEMKGPADAVAIVRAAGLRSVVAAPRVIKSAEADLWRALVATGADAVLVRSAGLLSQLAEARAVAGPSEAVGHLALHGDFSLNAANAPTARLLLASGLDRLAPTHDCDAAQAAGIAARLSAAEAAKLELIVHTHVPIFHTEHCVFARTLSKGNSYLDCGHPCERHTLHLRAADGSDSLVLADVGCRNTVFNAEAQSGARFVHRWLAAGVSRLRIELVDEPADVAVRTVELYAALLRGDAPAEEVLRRVEEEARDSNGRKQGVGEGSLRVQAEREWSAMKKTARR